MMVEIADTNLGVALHAKRADYEKAGVQEYLVVDLKAQRLHWLMRRGDRFVDLAPGPDGVYRSEAFPGLWLDPAALFRRDTERLRTVLDEGLATPEHAAFVEKLQAART
jgi:Uma2 family endonuclease